MIMRQSNRKSDVTVTIDRDSLMLSIAGIVTARSLDAILREIAHVTRHKSSAADVKKLIVDLSRVEVIRPGAAVSLVCLCSALMMNKLHEIGNLSEIYLDKPTERVLSYLTTIGFFTMMASKAKLFGFSELVRREEQWKERNKKRLIERISGRFLSSESQSVIWPMRIIGQKDNRSSYRKFEDDCQYLVNDAVDHFDELFCTPHFNFNQADRHDFRQTIYELYMNVYEHSGSWGVTMIHARPKYGTFICCYDIGIGIRKSLTDSPNVKETIENDYQAIKWGLVEGHSRKVGGSGSGLNVIEDFVSERNGIMEIRSGECSLRRTPTGNLWKPYHVLWFPGTQLNLFVPVHLEQVGG